jgi:hypothetical protein
MISMLRVGFHACACAVPIEQATKNIVENVASVRIKISSLLS